MSRTIYIVTRSTGTYEDARTVDLVAFSSESEAAERVKAIKNWFALHPRPTFDEVWDDEACEITGEKMRDYICPFDPDHFEADRLEEPDYNYHSLELTDDIR